MRSVISLTVTSMLVCKVKIVKFGYIKFKLESHIIWMCLFSIHTHRYTHESALITDLLLETLATSHTTDSHIETLCSSLTHSLTDHFFCHLVGSGSGCRVAFANLSFQFAKFVGQVVNASAKLRERTVLNDKMTKLGFTRISIVGYYVT